MSKNYEYVITLDRPHCLLRREVGSTREEIYNTQEKKWFNAGNGWCGYFTGFEPADSITEEEVNALIEKYGGAPSGSRLDYIGWREKFL